jgi:plastocyanin
MPHTLPGRYLTIIAATLAVSLASFALPGSAIAGGGCHIEGSSDARSTTVAMRNNCFAATVTRVDEGATVTFINEDEVVHNVTGAGYTWGGELELYEGDSVQHVFNENGVYVYSCLLHPGMVGAIVVGDGSGAGIASVTTGGSIGTGAARDNAPAETSSAAPAGDDAGGSNAATIALIAGGAALLVAIAAASIALTAARRTTTA